MFQIITRSAALIAVLAASACASYEPTALPVQEPKTLAFKSQLKDVEIAAEAVADPFQQRAHFDGDLTKAGVIAIRARLKNTSDRDLSLRPQDADLILKNGTTIRVATGSDAAYKVGEDGSIIGAGLAFGLIGVIAAANAEEQARKARTADYQSKMFRNTTLVPQEEKSGYLYFIPPAGTGSFEEASLRIPGSGLTGAQKNHVEIELGKIGYGAAVQSAARSRDGVDGTSGARRVAKPVAQQRQVYRASYEYDRSRPYPEYLGVAVTPDGTLWTLRMERRGNRITTFVNYDQCASCYSVTSGGFDCQSTTLGPDSSFTTYCSSLILKGTLSRMTLAGLGDTAVFYPVAGPALPLFEHDRSSNRFATTQHLITE